MKNEFTVFKNQIPENLIDNVLQAQKNFKSSKLSVFRA